MFNLDTKESVVDLLNNFRALTLDLKTENKLKLCDDLILACERFDINTNLISTAIKDNGGDKMDKLMDLSVASFKDLILESFAPIVKNDIISAIESINKSIADNKSNADLTNSNKLLNNENNELKEKINVMKNTIEKIDTERKAISDAHQKLSQEIEGIKTQARFNERLQSVSESGMDIKSLSKEEIDFIKNLDDNGFAMSLKVFSKNNLPKKDLANASAKQNTAIPTSKEDPIVESGIDLIEKGIKHYWK